MPHGVNFVERDLMPPMHIDGRSMQQYINNYHCEWLVDSIYVQVSMITAI